MVSVVIPTYNRSASLQRVLNGLSQQTYPAAGFEVIVVSDGSTDDTVQILNAAHPPYMLVPLDQPNQGPAQARNHGVAQARGEIILFLDDDVVPAPQCLAEHVKDHDAAAVPQVVLGPMLPPADFRLSPWVRWSQDRLADQYAAMTQGKWEPTARQFYTGNASLPRHLLQNNRFDPGLRRAEDVELAYRLAALGVGFIFNPRAIGFHYEQRSLAAWLAIAYSYGRNDVYFTNQKGHTWLLPTVLREYRGRSTSIRAVARACMDRPYLRRAVIQTMTVLAALADRISSKALLRLACSGMFNLSYYQGVADEMGGRQRFRAALASQLSN